MATKVLQNQVKQADFVRNRWAVMAALGTEISELVKPETWTHVAATLRAGDIIEVVPIDRSWFAEVYVTAAKGSYVELALLREVDFKKARMKTEITATDFEVKKYGAVGKYRVVRKVDGHVMKEDLTEAEGNAFIKELVK